MEGRQRAPASRQALETSLARVGRVFNGWHDTQRVQLTRGRDCCIVYVPPLRELDETAAWLQGCGVRVLD